MKAICGQQSLMLLNLGEPQGYRDVRFGTAKKPSMRVHAVELDGGIL